MAKKKQTLGEIYTDILSRPDMSGRWENPVPLSDCSVLGFMFPDAARAMMFRHDLMMNDVRYLFVDVNETKVIVVMLRDELQEGHVRNLAQGYEADDYRVMLK